MSTILNFRADARLRLLSCILLGSSLSAWAASPALQYNHDVRPILVENCFPCHGADSAARKAGLRLDRFAEATAPIKDSGPAIVPGKPAASELIHRINATDPDDIMPPAKTRKTLSPQEKALLTRWIADGAKYQQHWSLIAPVRGEPPKVHNKRWVRNPVDNFILARLEQAGLKPAPEADRRTLIRRVTLDLTGLPPTAEEVEAFVKDKSPNAYEKLVDHLLDSPHYGEHRARYWLDAARYADSNGIHFDNYREMWSYRDWVIQAFNANESFDQFTIEQLAGDLLPNHTLDQEVGSGFNRCNITSNEGGAIDEEYLVLYARDRTEATSQVWMGLTTGCAVCHDHKFDPISQKEFYSLSSFFNNTTQKAMDGNIQNTPPTEMVPAGTDRLRWAQIPSDLKTAQTKIDQRRSSADGDFVAWSETNSPEVFSKNIPKDTPLFHALLNDNTPTNLTVNFHGQPHEVNLPTNATWKEGVLADNAFVTSSKTTPVLPEVGDFEKDHSFSYGVWVFLTKEIDGAIFARMDNAPVYRGWDLLLQGGKPAAHMVSTWPGDAMKISSNVAIETNRWTHLFITYDGSSKVAGMKLYIDGKVQATTTEADKLQSSIRTKVPLKIGQRNAESVLNGARLQDLRIYDRTLNPAEVKSLYHDTRVAYLLSKPKDKWTVKQKSELYDDWLNETDSKFRQAKAAMEALEKEKAEIRSRSTEALVMNERTNSPAAYVLFRGEYDQRRDKVEPGTPAALPPMPADFPRNRLGFARWLMLPNQPLTARVTVNRFWQEIFGTGLVRTAGDFGVTGELPSHPELLDWLAVDFRESGWDMKRFFKMLVMSSAYRQSSVTTPDKIAKDGDNRLLSRGPRFRMDAEMIRDYALFSSGLMAPKIGGPSVKPYQPEGVWEAVAMIGSNTRDYKRDTGDKLYRRSLYTFWKRAAPPASLEIFNAPSRETCTVRRERGDTPLQALVTLNDPQFIEAARHLAQLTLEDGGSNPTARLDYMAERVLSRPLRPDEIKVTSSVLKYLLDHYHAASQDADKLVAVGESKADPKLDRPTLAAYTMVANELMNLDEVLNK